MKIRTETDVLVSALRILARDIQSNDGVANACIAEGAARIEELAASALPSPQARKVERLLNDGCSMGSVLLHKADGGHGVTAIVSPFGNVEWAG